MMSESGFYVTDALYGMDSESVTRNVTATQINKALIINGFCLQLGTIRMTVELSDCETVLSGRKKTVICVEFLGYIFHAAVPAFAARHRRCLSAVPEYR